jgi:hypothetical protein
MDENGLPIDSYASPMEYGRFPIIKGLKTSKTTDGRITASNVNDFFNEELRV